MSINRKKLIKGLKYQLIVLPLLVLAPVLITIGFKAIKLNNNYLYLLVGIVLAFIAILIGVLGIRIILSAFFDSEK